MKNICISRAMKWLCAAAFCLSPLAQLNAQTAEITLTGKPRIYETTLSGLPDKGILKRVPIHLPKYKRALFCGSTNHSFDYANRAFCWPVKALTEILHSPQKLMSHLTDPVNAGMFVLLELEDNSYAMIQALSTPDAMSWIEIRDDQTVDVVCGTMGTKAITLKDFPAFAYGHHQDLYQLIADVWKKAVGNKDIQPCTRLRKDKVYPEMFNYLGWCSWEHFHKNINEKNLGRAIDNIEASEAPIRWILIDDGHQNEEKTRLINFHLNAQKFPNGWQPLIQKRSDKIRWMGLWHCMSGLWNGFSPKNDIDELKPYIVSNKRGRLMLDGSEKAADLFYKQLVASAADHGFDFLKVDVQTANFRSMLMTDNPVRGQHNAAAALEHYAHNNLKGLMNCMASNLPCLMNTKYSATTRVSVDYALNNTENARGHIYQSFQNTPWMGQVIYPDHDMFHSSDLKYGQLMAISKAMSMAPIYLSDNPTDFKMEYIAPLADKEGRLIKPMAPGTPLPASLLNNVIQEKNCYQIIAPTTAHSAAIVSYHLCYATEAPLTATITPRDYTYADAMMQPYPGLRKMPKSGLIYYDWHQQKGGVLQQAYAFPLNQMTDRLVLLCEIEKGWAVIGDSHKYLSTAAVESYKIAKNKLTVTMKESTDFLIYSDRPLQRCEHATFHAEGNGFYRIHPNVNGKTCTIYR